MVQIKWTPQAVKDLEEIHEYIAKDSVKYAVRQTDVIRQKTQILKFQKSVGKPIKEFGPDKVRELIAGKYRIIYRQVNATQIDILTIHHGARDLESRNIH